MRKLKVISLILSVVLLLSVIPMFSATAAENVITDVQGLITAATNGGTVTVSSQIDVNQKIEVKKDLTIDLEMDTETDMSAYINFIGNPEVPYSTAFVISPDATLTINSDVTVNGINLLITRVAFELDADAQSGATLVLNGGRYSGNVLISSTAAAGDAEPTVIINDGDVYCETFAEGSAEIDVNAGRFQTDISSYVSSDVYVMPPEYEGDFYSVIKLSESFSDDFEKLVNADGKFVVNRYDYAEDGDYEAFLNDIEAILYKESPSGKYFILQQTEVENKVLISLYDLWNNNEEHHLLEYVFNYDPAIYEETKTAIAGLSKSENPDEMYYTYKVADLEFLDYSFDTKLGADNSSNSINYSKDFKNAIDKAYSVYLDIRMGGGGNIFMTEISGVGLILRDNVVYGTQHMGVRVDNIMYVPADTANTDAAKKTALQTRLDRLYGKGKVTIHESTLFDAFLWNEFMTSYEWISQRYPNPSFEDYKNQKYEGYYPALPDPEDPEYDQQVKEFLLEFTGIENATFETPAFLMEVNGVCYPIKIEANSGVTMPAEPTPEVKPLYKPIEKSTVTAVQQNVEAKLVYDKNVFPENTVINIEQQKQGEIVERVQTALNDVAKEVVVFEITAKSNNVSVQPNGKVQVVVQIPDNFDPNRTAFYYVTEDAKYEKVPWVVDSGKRIGTAELSHFSTYVLAQTPSSPATADNNSLLLLIAFAFISGAITIYSIKKIKA